MRRMLGDCDLRTRADAAGGILPLMTHVIRRREQILLGTSDATLRRFVARGDIVRIGPGSYLPEKHWGKLEPIDQHRVRVLEAVDRSRRTLILSHYAAAAMWGIRILGMWPSRIDVVADQSAGGRSSGVFARHSTTLDDLVIVERDGLLLTSPAQTVVDLARSMRFADAVATMDSALHQRRTGGALCTRDEIDERVAQCAGRRGYRRASAAAAFATPLSDSTEESHSRVQIHQLGFPAPELQVQIRLPSGRMALPDFLWRDLDHAGECDGRSKYTDPNFLRGRTAAEAVIDEKNRENELRQVVGRVSRWEPRHLYPPRQLYDILVHDGLPSSKPRP